MKANDMYSFPSIQRRFLFFSLPFEKTFTQIKNKNRRKLLAITLESICATHKSKPTKKGDKHE